LWLCSWAKFAFDGRFVSTKNFGDCALNDVPLPPFPVRQSFEVTAYGRTSDILSPEHFHADTIAIALGHSKTRPRQCQVSLLSESRNVYNSLAIITIYTTVTIHTVFDYTIISILLNLSNHTSLLTCPVCFL